jgi:glycosyltransferase involved in cell wall biosynthesis
MTRLVLLVHPPSFGTASMPRFAGMIRRGMEERGYQVETWTSKPRAGRMAVGSNFVRKWLRYVDQFLLYPGILRKRVQQQPRDTVFVVTDQALGMWVPCLSHRPHVIHCHDFLALKSARGEFPENPTGWTGRQYQRLILEGFSNGNAFISVSEKTRRDLHRFLPFVPRISEVVHNGLNYPFRPMEPAERTALLRTIGLEIPEQGFVLHISGNQWYKNPKGVLEIYRSYAASCRSPAPLWMVGAPATNGLAPLAASIPHPGKVHFLTGLTNEQINAVYSHAKVLLFPSLEEGFGWPVVEAMASGCPVITTNIAPMTEIAGHSARLISRMPAAAVDQKDWANSAAVIVDELVRLNGQTRARLLEDGKSNAARFDSKVALDAYEKVYSQVLDELN